MIMKSKFEIKYLKKKVSKNLKFMYKSKIKNKNK